MRSNHRDFWEQVNHILRNLNIDGHGVLAFMLITVVWAILFWGEPDVVDGWVKILNS